MSASVGRQLAEHRESLWLAQPGEPDSLQTALNGQALNLPVNLWPDRAGLRFDIQMPGQNFIQVNSAINIR